MPVPDVVVLYVKSHYYQPGWAEVRAGEKGPGDKCRRGRSYTGSAFVTSYDIALGVCIDANDVEIKLFIARVKLEFPRRELEFCGIQSYTRPRKVRQRHRRQKTPHSKQSKFWRIHVSKRIVQCSVKWRAAEGGSRGTDYYICAIYL